MKWLSTILAENSDLDLTTVDGRAQMAEAVIAGMPVELMRAAIIDSARIVLERRNVRDGGSDISRAIANSALQTTFLVLEADELDDDRAQPPAFTGSVDELEQFLGERP